jgi:restriction endonuclease S subunit
MPKLRDIASIRSGLAPPNAPPERASCLYVQIKDLDAGRRALIRSAAPTAGRATPIEEGDVLLAARGDKNVVVRPDKELIGAYPTLDIYLLRPDPFSLDPDYLAAFLEGDEGGKALRGAKAGSGLPRLPIDAVADLEVPLPPLHHQRIIGRLSVCAKEQLSLLDRLRAAEARLAEARLMHAFNLIEV